MSTTPTVQELYATLDVEHAKGRIFDGINAALEACDRHPRLDGTAKLASLLHAFAQALEAECASDAVRRLIEQYAPRLARGPAAPRLFAPSGPLPDGRKP